MPSWIRVLLLASLSLGALLRPVRAAAPDAVCELYVDKTARPTEVLVGQEVEVTLTLDGRCPEGPDGTGADIILAIDRSASQRDNGTWQPTIQAATVFVDLIDFSRNQVAILTFSGGLPLLEPDTVLRQALTFDGQAAKAALAAIPQPPFLTGATNVTAAVEAAQVELSSTRHRPAAQPVLVLLSDGEHNTPGTISPIDAATTAKSAGTVIITIGLAVNDAAAQTLRVMASRPELYFPAPTGADLEAVLREVAGEVTGGGRLTDLAIVDLLPPDVAYVDGSAVPPPVSFEAGTLRWNIPALDQSGWTARYRIRPLAPGTYATNKLAYVDYRDADGSAGSRVFPMPLITVRQPEHFVSYLPLLHRNHCQPERPFDVVLAMDTSSSMWGEKLTRSREAAREFLQFLPMPPSQAAVVAFNAEARLVQTLTASRASALAALDRLPRAEGTRLDLALATATVELVGARHDPDHARVVILLTDGRQAGTPPQAVLDAAAAARQARVTVYTIGIGPDVDPDLLTLVAGHPDRYYFAPTSADLARIYQSIAGSLPCIRQ